MRLPMLTALLCAAAALLAACAGGDDAPSAGAGNEDGTQAAAPAAGALRSIRLEPALGGRRFERPTDLGPYPGGRVLVAEQDGLLMVMDTSGGNVRTLLDLRGRVLRAGNEEGLLSATLDPRFPERPYVYLYYSLDGPRRNVLTRFEVRNDAAVAGSELVLLESPKPFSNHNGGSVRFGPDGMLYLGIGDGGSGGDPQGNAQNLRVILGKMLRLDVRNAAPGRPYEVPGDNPFTGRPDARGEIWAYGLRNPYRSSFDPATGRLYASDAGQNTMEEVDVIERGGNYGWNRLEGTLCYPAGSSCDRAGTILPVATYEDDEGCAVVGGAVYRGPSAPALVGNYVSGDYCSGRIWALAQGANSRPTQVAEPSSNRRISTFGVDGNGELYVLVHGGPALRVAGAE